MIPAEQAAEINSSCGSKMKAGGENGAELPAVASE